MAIKTIIVDDDIIWRDIFEITLQKDGAFDIVAKFESAEEAIEHIPELNPDIAIVDFVLQGMTGYEFAARLKSFPALKVVLITSHDPVYLNAYRAPGTIILEKSRIRELPAAIKALCAPATQLPLP